MKKLTTAEEQVMQVLWNLNKGFVKEIIAELPEPKPAYNTISTIIRILEQKEFVGHETFGKSHQYYPLISKEQYSHQYLKSFVGRFFSGSFENMVSFFAKKEDVNINELEDLLNDLESDKNKKE
ncbi:BlaI/MecI/CopY family transcriptional regulator [Flammeovirga yaeyamensis]|uniref:BlaI/MecI/CopY family transcriptional regulator n=1 Tax=Flammeovirga yaeyamensis TaxID=367791 RepID=A0AAX1NBB8_9BACT|nr:MULTISPECIES: BlaI/MecI/CopY family transcriptional regulator [Flammeovirga]ANQ49168.1 BlaI/MecI/CopY family transcriptional regulator [Flammeovirga sp. MY04]MBB3697969.1 putative transcriptional regulator [Flammeovirga yaeyamensis]NMF35679.1 BlaI/MecI/CopY family transcriptional regulator [Flammeovirga yaeyamensis]QWG03367.1 BlaI/MecI/CopY family transcriptional regulator [Flammeovirga yaeyamensis]